MNKTNEHEGRDDSEDSALTFQQPGSAYGLLTPLVKCDTTEGCVPVNHIDQFREQLKEGSIYKFESFIVPPASKKMNHPYRIQNCPAHKDTPNNQRMTKTQKQDVPKRS